MKRRSLLQLAAGLPGVALLGQAPKQQPKTEWIAWIGTYPRGGSKGIYAYRFVPGEHKFTSLGLAIETPSPSFLAVHPNQQFLYAVNEIDTFDGRPGGSVSAFAIDNDSGHLKQLSRVSTRGPGPCHLAIDRSGKWLFAANYNGGSVAAFPVREDGTVGEATVFAQHSGKSVNPQRQAGPHAHATVLSPDNRFVLVADLGMDEVLVYPIDHNAGGLAINDAGVVKLPPGSGPRHLVFRPDGKFVYVLNEITATVTTFRYIPQRGALEDPQTISMLPDGYNGPKSGAEIAIRGAFLYASNRGHDSIAIFHIDPATGRLTAAGHVATQGKTPRNFAIGPSGNYLLASNQDSDNIVMFRIDGRTGGLTPTGDVWNVGGPVCVVFSAVK
jgi:6-phosphogluconolactonase